MDQQTQTVSNLTVYVLCTYYTFIHHNSFGYNNTKQNIPVYTKLKCSADLNEIYSAFLNTIFDDNIHAEMIYIYQTLTPYMNEDIGFLVQSTNHAESHKLRSILGYREFVPDHFAFKTNPIYVDKSMWENLSPKNQELTKNINKNFIELCSMKKKDLYDLTEPKKKYFKWLSMMTIRKDSLIYDLLCKKYLQDKK